MRFEEFSRLTGWNATRTSRAVKTGLFRDKSEQGSGNAYEYTERDVLMARLTDEIRDSFEERYGTVLLGIIAAAVYEREDIAEYMVIHPPVASFLDNPEQVAQLLEAEGRNAHVLRLRVKEVHAEEGAADEPEPA